MTAHTLLAFGVATLALLFVPGPAVMYIVATSAARGRSAGLVSVAGIHVGTTVHVFAAMVGVSAIVVASATAFTVVKLMGAAYLVWLGIQSIRAWRCGEAGRIVPAEDRRPLRRIFVDGVVLNVLNPKTAIFFLAFVPHFVDPAAGNATLQVAALGTLFIALGLLSDGAYALAGSWVGGRLRTSPQLRRRTDLLAGATYLGLGAVTAVTGGHSA